MSVSLYKRHEACFLADIFFRTFLLLEHKLFVGMLPKNVSEAEVSALFSQYGTIKELQILRGSQQTSKGFYIFNEYRIMILHKSVYAWFLAPSKFYLLGCYAWKILVAHMFTI